MDSLYTLTLNNSLDEQGNIKFPQKNLKFLPQHIVRDLLIKKKVNQLINIFTHVNNTYGNCTYTYNPSDHSFYIVYSDVIMNDEFHCEFECCIITKTIIFFRRRSYTWINYKRRYILSLEHFLAKLEYTFQVFYNYNVIVEN